MTGWPRKLLTAASTAIVLASLWYLYGTAAHYGGLLPDLTLIGGQGAVLAGLAVLYLAGLLVLADVWFLILRGMSAKESAARPQAYASFLASQIVKYLPSGIFHLLGRFGWLVRHGYDKAAVAKATLVELGGMAALSLVIATVGLLWFPPESSAVDALVAALGIAAVPLPLGIAAGGVAAAVVWIVFRKYFWQKIKLVSPLALVGAISFFLLQAIVFAGCYHLTAGEMAFSLVPIFTLSWFVGFVVVGAPGGIGVREATFVLLSTGVSSPEYALGSIVLFRLVTLAAEIAAFVIGYGINARYKNQAA